MRPDLGTQLLDLLFLQKMTLFFFFMVDSSPYAGHPIKTAVQIANLVQPPLIWAVMGGDWLSADGKGVKFLQKELQIVQTVIDQPGADGQCSKYCGKNAKDGNADRYQRGGPDAAVIH